MADRRDPSPPPLLDHPLLPQLPCRQHFLLIAADLRLNDFELRTDQQPDPNRVSEQRGSRLAAVLWRRTDPQFDQSAVPVGALRAACPTIVQAWGRRPAAAREVASERELSDACALHDYGFDVAAFCSE